MNILVIGNGFDIAHGLPTKYGDFLDFIRKYKQLNEAANISVQKAEGYEELIRLKSEHPGLYDEIEVLIKDNAWYQHFDSIYESRKIEGKDGWIDFEREISSVVQLLDKLRCQIVKQLENGSDKVHLNNWQVEQLKIIIWGNVHLDYSQVEIGTCAIQTIKDKLILDLNRITRCLEIYLAHCIHTETCTPLPVIKALNIHSVLSFNYTDTYRLLYDDENKQVRYHYIHGIAKEESNIDECNMIIGIDEYLNDSSKNSDNVFVEFKKFFQRIFKGTGNIYTEWIHAHQQSVNAMRKAPNPPTMNVYIFGHSLDNTDGDVLRKLILQEHTKTTIFYHNREALGKQIANLVAVIGEDELIKRTDKGSQTIFFETVKSVTNTITEE